MAVIQRPGSERHWIIRVLPTGNLIDAYESLVLPAPFLAFILLANSAPPSSP